MVKKLIRLSAMLVLEKEEFQELVPNVTVKGVMSAPTAKVTAMFEKSVHAAKGMV